jgi:replicative DNA helicase
MTAGKQAPAVVLDYLHLLTGGNDDLQERIKIAVKGLKDYASKYDTFVICITAISKEDMNKGKITLASGRDSSNIPYTADLQISLNYYEVDAGKVKIDDQAEMERLQSPLTGRRDMILRVLKNRFGTQGKSVRVDFDAAHNIFYRDDDKVMFEEAETTSFDDQDFIQVI